MKEKSSVSKNALKVAFYGAAAVVGVLMAVSAVKKRGSAIGSGGKKLIKKARNEIKSKKDRLNMRQKRILSLFDKEEKITNEMISSVIEGVTKRTLRRDMDFLEEKGYVKQIGRTKGSYYMLS
ncbi:MAG: DeoR family transcriptional regulator [Patescibacteria group bacterium]|nr:DeoR family transcriptional regulator [Patescibacteria group bacterium]